MLEPLLNLISIFYDYLKPFWIVEQYNKAVLLRWGKYVRVAEPGFHWKWPLSDIFLETSVVTTTVRLHSQSLFTKDEKPIVTQAIIKYKVVDVKVFLMEVYEAIDAIGDMTQAIIKNVLMESTWEECKNPDIDSTITRKARNEAKKWGIEIIQVTLVDLTITKSLRLIASSFSPNIS